jgi:phosphoglycolate phosphatase-like HAD superfamily hydrolase
MPVRKGINDDTANKELAILISNYSGVTIFMGNNVSLVVFSQTINTPILNRKKGPYNNGTVFFDMDDTLHEAEKHLMKHGWRHLIRPFGYEWKPDGEEGRLGLKPVSADQEPGVGIRPLEVAKHFIQTLGLSLDGINVERFAQMDFQRIDELLTLQKQKESMSEDAFIIAFAKILEAERIDFTCQRIRGVGVKPMPGAYETVSSFHDDGYRVVIVTSSPDKIAKLVLEDLDLINYIDEEKHKPLWSKIDVIVSGDMPKKPKPAKDPIELADRIIWYLSLERVYEERFRAYQLSDDPQEYALLQAINSTLPAMKKAKAYFGDSWSDAKAGKEYGIPTIIIFNPVFDSENTTVQKLRAAGATFIIPTLEGMGPRLLESMLATLPETWQSGFPAAEQTR